MTMNSVMLEFDFYYVTTKKDQNYQRPSAYRDTSRERYKTVQ